MDKRTIFWGKNGRSFSTALIRAADGDKQITKMFTDNVLNIWGSNDDALNKTLAHISGYVKQGRFKLALARAFQFDEAREGKELWAEVFDNLININ